MKVEFHEMCHRSRTLEEFWLGVGMECCNQYADVGRLRFPPDDASHDTGQDAGRGRGVRRVQGRACHAGVCGEAADWASSGEEATVQLDGEEDVRKLGATVGATG